MNVKEYNNAGIFLADYEAMLLEHEAVSQLLLYSAYQNRYQKLEGRGAFGAVTDDDKTVLLFCNVLPSNLYVYAAGEDGIIHGASVLGDYFGENHISINGIVARNEICTSFIEKYRKQVGCVFVEKLGLNIMEVRKVNDIKPAPGKQRLATMDESKQLTEWMIEYQIEALMSELDYEAALKKVMKYIEDQCIYLYENEENQMVSMAIAARKLSRGIAISYVYTPEKYRGNGYAAANMYYLSKHLLEQGYEFCTLFVDNKNLLSNRAYEKVGYHILDENYEYVINPA